MDFLISHFVISQIQFHRFKGVQHFRCEELGTMANSGLWEPLELAIFQGWNGDHEKLICVNDMCR